MRSTSRLGLARTASSLNVGREQEKLDNLRGVVVEVTALAPPMQAVPHVELLCYRGNFDRRELLTNRNDVAATQLAFEAEREALDAIVTLNRDTTILSPTTSERGGLRALLRDPDGHLLCIETALPNSVDHRFFYSCISKDCLPRTRKRGHAQAHSPPHGRLRTLRAGGQLRRCLGQGRKCQGDRRHRGTPFHIIALEPHMVTDTLESYTARISNVAAQRLDRVKDAARAAGVECDVVHAQHEHPYQAIIDTAVRRGCDLIVMASHGRRGVSAIVLGSETVKVLTHSMIPVLVYRGFQAKGYFAAS